jgi:hypothetical protein
MVVARNLRCLRGFADQPVAPFLSTLASRCGVDSLILVIEKSDQRVGRFLAPMKGTEWQPF